MFRMVVIFAVALLGCTGMYPEEPCGHQRSLTVWDTLPGLNVYLSLVDEEDRPDGFSWQISVPGQSQGVTAVHLHDATPGNGGRMLYDLMTSDVNLDHGFTVAGGGIYSLDTSIESLFDLVRSGRTYVDVHTTSAPEGAVRADITEVEFEDWSGYYCS